MALFIPAFDKTSTWEPKSHIPSAVVIQFLDHGEAGELYRFIDILTHFLELNHDSPALLPMPLVRNDNGKEIPLGLLSLIRKHRCNVRLTFYLFGDYFRDVLRAYCKASLAYHDDTYIRECFKQIHQYYRLDESLSLQ